MNAHIDFQFGYEVGGAIATFLKHAAEGAHVACRRLCVKGKRVEEARGRRRRRVVKVASSSGGGLAPCLPNAGLDVFIAFGI